MYRYGRLDADFCAACLAEVRCREHFKGLWGAAKAGLGELRSVSSEWLMIPAGVSIDLVGLRAKEIGNESRTR